MNDLSFAKKKEIVGMFFITWGMKEQENPDYYRNIEHEPEIENLITSSIILDRIYRFDLNFIVPDPLLTIIYFCSEGNPGLAQMMFKDLFDSIRTKKNFKSDEEYLIKTEDFIDLWRNSFPYMEYESVAKKYLDMWDEQKNPNYVRYENKENLCDTKDWWSYKEKEMRN